MSDLQVTNKSPKREAVLFVRVQEVNKTWAEVQAKKSGFSDTASYIDALLTKARVQKSWKQG